MYDGIKIFVGVVFALAIVSLVYLTVGGKKAPATATKTRAVQASQASGQKLPAATGGGLPVANGAQAQTVQDKGKMVQGQWQQCKAKTFSPNSALIWSVQISEGIPAGGTYAKGTLNNDSNFPVHVTIKSDSPNIDKIKARIVVGKIAILRGNCTDVASDGSVVLQAF